jgi:hypothetical protein
MTAKRGGLDIDDPLQEQTAKLQQQFEMSKRMPVEIPGVND